MDNRLLDECSDSAIVDFKRSFIEPALKYFYNILLMKRVDEMLANGNLCRGL